MENVPQEGNTPQIKVINEWVINECPQCSAQSVLLSTRKLLEGDLELYFAIHTEVEDTFICWKCKNSWSETHFM
jgi:hypothetical protein